MSEILQIARKRWDIVGQAYADFQGRLIAVLFYFTIFVPFALAVRLASDPLHLRKADTRWLDRTPVGTTLDDARRQF
ncbi:MAG TPA: hypothetical protein PKD09_06805 [Aggregatilinea sp.]|uniref:hypothetical protein n=1 Tax=Aggregatilinea sp. TaxID=2806333 RepID=UPI002D0EB05A|nr:hypothetical protein [Aggregatilinea sp.]HML21336.1 hypothetical protein [Aggregatilinea sp.]